MSEDQPHFRFNPRAYDDGQYFECSHETCELCARPCVWKYTGGIYVAGPEPSILCARCIANGALRAFFGDRNFQLQSADLPGADPDLTDEVQHRTPGVPSYQDFDWPVLDGKPMAFVGYGEDKGLFAIPAVRSAIEAAFEEIGRTCNGSTSYALIFKEIDGDRYRAVIDLD
jgi:uncharacterized protein CbrC (UPF0167 family)